MIRRVHVVNVVRKFALTTALFLAPLHFLKLGFSGVEIGLVVSCYSVAPIVFSFPTGWLNDRLSMNAVIRTALVLQGLAFLLIGLAPSAGLMAALFFVVGIANNAMDVSAQSLYYKDDTEPDANRKYGLYNFWMAVGSPFGLVAGGALYFFSGYRVLTAALGGLMAVAALVLRGFGHERFSVVSMRDYRTTILRKQTLAFAALLFFLAMHWGVEGTIYSPFLRERFGLNGFGVALYMALAYIALAGGSFLVSRLPFDPARDRRLLLLSLALSGVGLVFMVQDDVRLSFLFRLVHETGDGLTGALILLTVSRLFEKRLIGGSAGALLAIQTAGLMTGAMIFPAIGFRAGLQYPFYIAGALLVANAFFGLYAVPRETNIA